MNMNQMKAIQTKIYVLSLFLASLQVCAQESNAPKNFPEVFAGVEWNSISGLTGVSYERYIVQKGRWVFGARVSHAFTYNLGNLSLTGSASEETASFNSVTGTAHKFFSENDGGFFLCTELGLGLRKRKYYEVELTNFFTAFEAGLGWQFRIGNKIAVRWTNAATFAGKGAITMTKLSVGF